MIEENTLIINGIETKCVVFTPDNPIEKYYELSLIAAISNDELSKNYKKPIHKNKEFITLFLLEEQPLFMFATEKDPILPKNVGRAFNRAFMNPKVRYTKLLENGISKLTENFKYFYNFYPKYHTSFGIQNLFITRNCEDKNKIPKGLVNYFKPMNFILYESPLIYNGVPQWFFIKGDPSFCDKLEKFI